MDKIYKVLWSQTALDELAGILAYPPDWIDGIKHKRENVYWKQK
ncbi:hypothetical protein MHI37_05500 [Paenibacillus sp. FSL H8-0548]|nr:hypothetical protein [Paenibacillus sp. FSL H8-0548]